MAPIASPDASVRGVAITAPVAPNTGDAAIDDAAAPDASERVLGVRVDAASGGTDAGGTLPRTGAEVDKALWLSALFLIIGGVLLRLSGLRLRRIRSH